MKGNFSSDVRTGTEVCMIDWIAWYMLIGILYGIAHWLGYFISPKRESLVETMENHSIENAAIVCLVYFVLAVTSVTVSSVGWPYMLRKEIRRSFGKD